MMDMFMALMLELISQRYTYTKSIKLHTLNRYSFLQVNHTSVKWYTTMVKTTKM